MPHPFGFTRVAAAVPQTRVGDVRFHVEQVLALLDDAQSQEVQVAVFPELCLTGYTCGDLFHQTTLLKAAREGLLDLVARAKDRFGGLGIVGLPLVVNDQLYNSAAIFQKGQLLGVVPKSYLPNYKEFYEARWFAPGAAVEGQVVSVGPQRAPFGTDLLFDAGQCVVGVEICEDLWTPVSPSSMQTLAGANLLVNLSASNELIGKAGYRRQLVLNQSARCLASYVYVSCGPQESTTDLVFGGHCLIAENGVLLAESKRFERKAHLTVADVDLQKLETERIRTSSFGDNGRRLTAPIWFRIPFEEASVKPGPLLRTIDAHPFVPQGQDQLRERCDEIFHTQVAGLAKRLENIGKPKIALGVSGGLDSTLALLVACKTLDLIGSPRSQLQALTMPGFGTSRRTLDNAQSLMRGLGVAAREVDIRLLCLEEMRALSHKPFGIDLTGLSVESLTEKLKHLQPEGRNDLVFENVQARMRTSLLMNTAFVVGTGDLSELALGWCTYNGDHISMYNPNVSIPKTLVRFLVRWAAENEFEGETRRTLLDIAATVISPELLPTAADGGVTQSTEGVIGPYELHDFFLFHFLRYGASPAKILYLAEQAAFDRPYLPSELRSWLKVFVTRFFQNQFKRSCLPDGPKVGSISLSPRGDWRMPSDASATEWLEWANGLSLEE